MTNIDNSQKKINQLCEKQVCLLRKNAHRTYGYLCTYHFAPSWRSTLRNNSKKGEDAIPVIILKVFFRSKARICRRNFPCSPSCWHLSMAATIAPPVCRDFDATFPRDPRISPTSNRAVPMTRWGNCPFLKSARLEASQTMLRLVWASFIWSFFSVVPAAFASKSKTPTSM